MKIKAILWDMDGVLTDTEFLHSEVESKTAKHFGVNISPAEVRQKYSGVLLRKEFAEIFSQSNKNISYEEMREVRDKILIEEIKGGMKLIPHVKEILEELSKKYDMALVSSTEKFWAEKALTKISIYHLFKTAIFGEDVQNHKPHPEPYLKAMEILNIKPSETVIIEDSASGQKSAKASGAILIARKSDHNGQLDFSQADFVISDLREIPKIIEKINHES